MKARLEHRIYGATKRVNLSVLATSDGITADLANRLSTCELGYPGAAEHGASAPFITRGYALEDANKGYGVTRLFKAGATVDRAKGNYVAHSYVVQAELMEAQHQNLPWIASFLRCDSGYRPTSAAGSDPLPLAAVEIVAEDQFRLAVFVLRELGAGVVGSVLARALSDANPLALTLPPSSPHTQPLYEEAMAGAVDKPELVDDDDLRLLRLAGLVALLPVVLRRRLSFSVNEPASPAYSLCLSRELAEAGAAPAAMHWPWLNACAELALKGEHQGIGAISLGVSKLIRNRPERPREALDQMFQYFDRGVRGREPPWRGASSDEAIEIDASRISRLAGSNANVAALYEQAAAIMAVTPASASARCRLFQALSHVNKTEPLPGVVIEGLLDCRDFEEAKVCVSGLVPLHLAQAWLAAMDRSPRPPLVPRIGGGVDEPQLVFALNSIDPAMLPHDSRPRIAGMLLEALLAGDLADLFEKTETHGLTARKLRGLATLCASDCKPELAAILVAKIREGVGPAAANGHPAYTHVLDLMYARESRNVAVLADFVGLLDDTDQTMRRVIHNLSLMPARIDTSYAFIRRLAFLFKDHPVWRGPLAALQELMEVLKNPEWGPQSAIAFLPAYGGLCARFEQRQRPPSPNDRRTFAEFAYDDIHATINNLQPVQRVAVGALYLWVRPDEQLIDMLGRAIQNEMEGIARWMSESPGRRPSVGAGAFLAQMLTFTRRDKERNLAVRELTIVMERILSRDAMIRVYQDLGGTLQKSFGPNGLVQEVSREIERLQRKPSQ